jgi:EthD domain
LPDGDCRGHPKPASRRALELRDRVVRGDKLNREHASIDFDVVTELVFADRVAFLAWGAKLFDSEQVATDEAKFLDRPRTRAYVIEEHVTSE